jgi:small subunit ribosomal protein S3Ae
MAAKRRITKKLDKKKKKRWLPIFAPKNFGGAELGESHVATPQNLMGKVIRANVSKISRIRSQNIRLKFEVTEVRDEQGFTEVVLYELLKTQINRIARKNKSKLDASLTLKTKDNQKIKIKPIIITRGIIKGGTHTSLKAEVISLLEKEVKKLTFDELLDSIMKYDLQKSLKAKLKSITPVNTIEIKHLSKIKEK